MTCKIGLKSQEQLPTLCKLLRRVYIQPWSQRYVEECKCRTIPRQPTSMSTWTVG
ncbi:hypothetical protein SCLCIDRAFT_1211809 [Scleroderma citrinum Foug A]|uniref:Uncharacterized protein n=1 Tax=Scleroderma citrinum Foug A TaxID=1036808 RepID=A0A0C2ZWG9_9AGAM|nr:hypothetical protein SCLCIDRAFT_1211809 [Scleroderma citrinum Foug A]